MRQSHEFPGGPFTQTDLDERGIPRAALRGALASRSVRRVTRGVYLRADVPDSLELRTRVIARVVTPGHVAIDRTAAWLYGFDLLDGPEPREIRAVEICALRSHRPTGRTEARGRTRDLRPEDVVERDGVLVTTPLRTALDLGCILRRPDALAALDQFRRTFDIGEAELARHAVRYFRRRGVVQLRELIPLSSPLSESVRESWTRMAIHDAGLPAPVLQYEVEVDGTVLARLDHAYPGQRVAVEYDGYEFHHTLEQELHDETRRDWLADNGWRVVVVRRGGFTGDRLNAWLDELRFALTAPYTNLRW